MTIPSARQSTSALSPTWWRTAIGVVIFGVLLWRLGSGPFLAGIRRVDGWTILIGLLFGFTTTLGCAWRWWLVARALGVPLQLRAAVTACYRSQFLNATLPGGVLGDVHRALSHGQAVGDVSRSVRAVVWERSAGQLVQVLMTAVVLLVLPSPIHPPVVVVVTGAALLTVLLLVGLAKRGGTSWPARLLASISTDLRSGLFNIVILPGIITASALAVTSMIALFIVAAQIAGSSAAAATLLPLALLALLAMAVPTNIGGWGAREGATAALFASAGLGADVGVATAIIYGVMVLAGSLPGALVLAASWRGKNWPARLPTPEPGTIAEQLARTGGRDHG